MAKRKRKNVTLKELEAILKRARKGPPCDTSAPARAAREVAQRQIEAKKRFMDEHRFTRFFG